MQTLGEGDCCGPAYDKKFGDRFARRVARRYERRGLTRPSKAVVDFLADRGISGATVLEIGGGVGQLQVELLLHLGALRAVNLEISNGYEPEAAELLERSGLNDRVDRRLLDIAQAPDDVASADVVVLHRVVCCYADYARLLMAAADKANRLLVFSYPPRNVLTVARTTWNNAMRRMRGDSFRTFVHPPRDMWSVVEEAGLHRSYRWRGLGWRVVGFERSPDVSPPGDNLRVQSGRRDRPAQQGTPTVKSS